MESLGRQTVQQEIENEEQTAQEPEDAGTTTFVAEPSKTSAKLIPEADWRDYPLLDCNKFMLKFQLCCDTVIRVGWDLSEHMDFGCHSYMLCARSVVFERMLYGESSASHLQGLGSAACDPEKARMEMEAKRRLFIDITDVDPLAFWEVLRHVYHDEADLSRDTVFKIYYAATKFRLHLLEKECRDWIRDNVGIDESTVCPLMDESLEFKAYFLTTECVEFIDSHPALWNTNAFRRMSKDALERVYVYCYLQPYNKMGGTRPATDALS